MHAPSARPGQRHPGVLVDLWRFTQLGVGFYALYSMVAHVASSIGALAADQPAARVVGAPGITVTLPDPLAEIIIACIVTGVLTYMLLKYLCQTEWVQEPVEVKKCWEEIKWYNPWSWVKAIVCTVVEVLKWVLKQICGWVEVLVVILVITCIIVGIIIVAA